MTTPELETTAQDYQDALRAQNTAMEKLNAAKQEHARAQHHVDQTQTAAQIALDKLLRAARGPVPMPPQPARGPQP